MLTHRKQWVDTARPNQLPPPNDDWDIWLYLAGRGNGKTRLAGEKVAWDTWQQEETITHVVAATHGDLRSVCYEGESGLLRIIPPECIKSHGYNRSLGEIHLTNGSIFRGYSAETPDRARGPQCHRLWGDELAAWEVTKGAAQEMFDQVMLGLRLGEHSYSIFSTTPKPVQLIRNLSNLARGIINEYNEKLAELRVKLTIGHTHENFSNLSKNYKILVSQYEGTRLGRQELHAEILEDIQGALWNIEIIERLRIRPADLPELVRIVVSIDPAAATTSAANETGIIVCGIDEEGEGYILEDASGKYRPNEWAEKAIGLYKSWRADFIIGEINNGGDMVEATLRGVDVNIPFKAVRASKGKVARAEPVSALYEQGKVHHVGIFPRLEDQMCTMTSDPISRSRAKRNQDEDAPSTSPDRADALVWGCTELILGEMDGQGIYEYYRSLNKNREVKTGVISVETVLMGTNQGISTVFGRDGKRYDVASNGTVRVPASEVGTLRKHGFREMETNT